MGRIIESTVFCVVTVALAGCASADRGSAASLAEAGINSTSALERDVRDTVAKLEYVDVTEAFTATWQLCQNPGICSVMVPSNANYAKRRQLVQSIALRAQALSALKNAYRALENEANYDAREDLEGTTSDAINAVNSFASSIAPLAPAPLAAVISQPIAAVFSAGAGFFAGSQQKSRILEANRLIENATKRFRDALAAEKYAFVSIEDYLALHRKEARLALLDAGLVSRSSVLMPMAKRLDMTLVKNADSIIAKSNATKTSVEAVIEAQSRADLQNTKRKYDAALSTLDSLLVAHSKILNDRGLSLSDINSNISALNAALEDQTGG